ncbi:Thiol-disulfide oxidoreductase ResA [Enhygromyxa salina]|uniref:Thiol-disulfide oxidoreductase ResA n=1 Tax=Enhygromyxa salina TaxID=215803 RepID=A0A2S9YD18_9BACT|nr:TlpA disulfide reductase family protein [Enhygromyxa salina]PRQ02995.1 Thiol-disulfide oxidoreductase ResA [Enhygromyxa salina]
MSDPREGSRLGLVVGALVVALTLLSGARDLGLGLDNWASYTPVTPGDPLPEFAVQLDDGSSLSSADLEGQVSLLVFWATWCHACGLEMPTVVEIDQRYAERGGEVRVYGVNRDSGAPAERRALVEPYAASKGMDFAQIYDDGQLAQAFGVEQIPYMVLVDKRGAIRSLHLGQVSERKLRGEIDALLDE